MLSCPLCSSNESTVFHTWPEFEVRTCSSCGFRFTNLDAWSYPYSGIDYYEINMSNNIAQNQSHPHISRRISDITKYVSGGRALDLGCGLGEVSVLLSARGFSAVGLDESANAINALRQRFPQVDWRCGLASELLPQLGQFDVITLYHVLEHIPHPVEALREVMKALRPGGIIVIEVPNMEGRTARRMGYKWHYYLQHHVNYFGPRHITKLAETLECEILEVAGYYDFTFPRGALIKDAVKATLATLGFKDIVYGIIRNPTLAASIDKS